MRPWERKTWKPAAISAEELNAQLKPKLDAITGVVNVLQTLPNFMRVLSLKVMANGDLNLYLEPA